MESSDDPRAVLLCADLWFASRVEAAAARVGMPLEIRMSVELLFASLDRQPARLLILDLSSGVDPRQVAPLAREKSPGMSLVAFGPHVQEERLAAARDAGCDLVLSRGQFQAQLDELLTRYLPLKGDAAQGLPPSDP